MRGLSRRTLLRAGAALGVGGLVPGLSTASESSEWEGSPDLAKFAQPLPIPEERTPDGTRKGVDYHEVAVREAQHEFHPDLGTTTIWGYDGQFPGPIIAGQRNERLAISFDNSELPDEHLFDVDDHVHGTTTENYVGYDGAVPEVRTVTHIHGLNAAPEDDGQAEMWTSPDGVEGPRYPGPVREVPHRQDRLTSSYHDHARGISRLNNYAGLAGPYYIRSRDEERLGLPDGEYDVPLVLADRSFTADGELHYPDEFVANFAGDTATVNGAAWPYMEVEPRKYRFRLINLSNGRTYDLGLQNDDGHHGDSGPMLHQISPGHGFLDDVVSIGDGGDMASLVLAPFERADVVVDFSEHAGETFTVTNDAAFPYEGGGGHDDGGGEDGHDDGMSGMDGGMDGDMDGGMHHGGDHPQIDEVMQFRVAETATSTDTTTDPVELSLPSRTGANPKAAKTTRQITMGMEMDDHGLMVHTLNGNRWSDPIEVRPQLGTTEVWELVNDTNHTHPIHLHMVAFDVLEREKHGDHGETRPPLPNERGGKDVVRVDPGETVRIAAKFGDFAGTYPFHCHILEHEEHDMMRMFEVVTGNAGHGDENGRGEAGGPQGGPDGTGEESDGRATGRGEGRGRGN